MISFTDAHQANDLFYMSSIKSDLDDSNGSNGSNQSPQNSRTSEQRTLVSPPHQNDTELIIKSKQSEQNEQLADQHILSEGQHQGQFILTLDNIKPELKDTETITVTIPPAGENNGSPNIPYTIGKSCPDATNLLQCSISLAMNSVDANSFYTAGSLSSVIPQIMLQPNCNYMSGEHFTRV